ncbi:MAG: 3-isopropylmalate dehydratase small subunit [Opitutales bacterium]|nr:3-isopropylmalate dehydratase small subunit [Opitutales bacterium]
MALEKITKVTGRGVYVAGDDIDTDRIIPARFMKCITFDGLGEFAFYDVRKNEDGTEKKHILNDPRFAGASILLSGSNFGCGSSREHAPQSLHKAGYRGIIAESYAEIFFGNSTTLGIPCFSCSPVDIKAMAALIEKDPQIEITLDVVNEKVQVGEQTFPAEIRDSAKRALVEGKWDPIAELLEGAQEVKKKGDELEYV